MCLEPCDPAKGMSASGIVAGARALLADLDAAFFDQAGLAMAIAESVAVETKIAWCTHRNPLESITRVATAVPRRQLTR
jgi:hypothetical protein